MLGLALFAFETIQQGSEVFNFPAEREHSHLFFAQSALQVFELPQNFAKLALHRKRALGALFSTCDRHVVEAFSRLREEKRVGIFESQATCGIGAGNDVAVAKLRENYLQRLSEAVENANRMFQRHDGSCRRRAMCSFIQDEGELGLRVLGMNQEGGAAVDVAAQQAQAFVGSVPGLDHDVVQLVAQEVFHHALETRLDFKKIREHADRREAALHHPRLEKAANRLGGVSVFCDHCLQRSFLAESGGRLRAENIKMSLGSVFLRGAWPRSGGEAGRALR